MTADKAFNGVLDIENIDEVLDASWSRLLSTVQRFESIKISFDSQDEVDKFETLLRRIGSGYIRLLYLKCKSELDLNNVREALRSFEVRVLGLGGDLVHDATVLALMPLNIGQLQINNSRIEGKKRVTDVPCNIRAIRIVMHASTSVESMCVFFQNILGNATNLQGLFVTENQSGSIISLLSMHLSALENLRSLSLIIDTMVDGVFLGMMRTIIAACPRLISFTFKFLDAAAQTILHLIQAVSQAYHLQQLTVSAKRIGEFPEDIISVPINECYYLQSVEFELCAYQELANILFQWLSTLPSLKHLVFESTGGCTQGPAPPFAFPQLESLRIIGFREWMVLAPYASDVFQRSTLKTLTINGDLLTACEVPIINAPLRELHIGPCRSVPLLDIMRILKAIVHPESLEYLDVMTHNGFVQPDRDELSTVLSSFVNMSKLSVRHVQYIKRKMFLAICKGLTSMRYLEVADINTVIRYSKPSEGVIVLLKNLPFLRELKIPRAFAANNEDTLTTIVTNHPTLTLLGTNDRTSDDYPSDPIKQILIRNADNARHKYTPLVVQLLGALDNRFMCARRHT